MERAVLSDLYQTALNNVLTVSRRTKLIALSATLGLSLIGLLTQYLKRRRTSRATDKRNGFSSKRQSIANSLNQNGDIRRSVSPSSSRYTNRPSSVTLSNDRYSVGSTLTSNNIANMSSQQLGLMGMEALETAINYWEDALHATIPNQGAQLAISDSEKSSFNHLLEKILERAYHIQRTCESLFLNQNSVLFRDDASVASNLDRYMESERRTIISMSSMDSFVSAQAEVADLREFDEFWDVNHDFSLMELYTSSLKQLEETGIPYRSLRSEAVGCQSDVEYLAKLNCIRLAFQFLFKDDAVKRYFIDSGRDLIVNMLLRANKDPKDILIAFDKLMSYVREDKNWTKIDEELRGRGVKCMTFYDIVLDFIILDAFEDLDAPPSSVTAVVQNRWLSNGFKEIALATAVWSVLKAKRQLLKFSDGFISHFYAVSEHLSPVLAWGFLGPESELKDICYYFKEQVFGFLHDIYSFHKTRYTTLEDLAQDVLSLAKVRYEITSSRISL